MIRCKVGYGELVWRTAVLVTKAGAAKRHSLRELVLMTRSVGGNRNWRRTSWKRMSWRRTRRGVKRRSWMTM